MTSTLRIDHQVLDGALVVSPVGRLDVSTYPQLRDALLKLAAEVPRALVVDLDGVEAELVTSLSVFPTVWMRASSWPGIPLLLVSGCDPVASLLQASAVPRFVPTHPSVAEALAAVSDPPRRRRAELELPCDPMSSRWARGWLRDIYAEWDLGAPDVAVLVASELVENATWHACSPSVLRLELRPAECPSRCPTTTPGRRCWCRSPRRCRAGGSPALRPGRDHSRTPGDGGSLSSTSSRGRGDTARGCTAGRWCGPCWRYRVVRPGRSTPPRGPSGPPRRRTTRVTRSTPLGRRARTALRTR